MFFTGLVLPRFLPRSIKTFQFFVKRIIRGVTGFFKHFPSYVFGRRFLFAHTRIVRALKLFMYYFLLPRDKGLYCLGLLPRGLGCFFSRCVFLIPRDGVFPLFRYCTARVR